MKTDAQEESDVLQGRFHWIRAALLTAAAVLLAGGCGDDVVTGNECAAGTTELDGECVVDAMACGEGTQLQGTQCVPSGDGGLDCGAGTVEMGGECVPESTTVCGPGTTRNTEGECVPDSMIVCGPGTVEDSGACVPESTLECGPGTVADESGACVADLDMVCGAGTVIVEGVCLDAVEALRTMTAIEEANEPNDPLIGAAATPVTLAAAGDSILLHGTIGAPTADGADWDGWAFATSAPAQVIRVTGISAGLPSPWFVVIGDLDGDGTFDYQRSSPVNEDTQPSRDVVLPVAGNYVLFVTDRLNAEGGTAGSEAYEYFAIVETLPPLTAAGAEAITVGASPITALPEEQKVVHDNVFHITPSGAADELVVFDRPVFDNAYAFQTLLLFDPADMRFVGLQPFTFCVEDFFGTQCYLRGPFGVEVAAAGLIAVLDADSITGPGELGTTVTLEAAPALPSDFAGTLSNGGLDFFDADVPAGSLLEVTVSGGQDVQPFVQFRAADGTAFVSAQDDDGDGAATARWYFEAATSVQVVVADGALEDPAGTDYAYTLVADQIPVTALGTLDPASGTSTVSASGLALDAAADDVEWLAVEVVPSALEALNLTVSDASAEVGFDLYLQSEAAFARSATAFPESGVATATLAVEAPVWALVQLVALSGASTMVQAEASLNALPSYTGEGDLCSTAVTLAGSGAFAVDLASYTNAISGSSVFGDCGDGFDRSARSGEDSFFLVSVPDGMTLSVDVSGAGPGGSGDDALVALLQNDATLCTNLGVDNTAFACLEYDDDSGAGLNPSVSWSNATGAAVEVMVVVDNWFTADAGDSNVVSVTVAP